MLPMTDSATLTVRVPQKTKKRLEALAKNTKRSKSFLAAEAIASYLDTEAWQVERIKAAIENADAHPEKGIPHEEVDRWLASWGGPGELAPPKCG
jgi:RHH-type rel operon transcriptional repressor/antitoxin RelB